MKYPIAFLSVAVSLASTFPASASPGVEHLCYAQCVTIDTQANTVQIQGTALGSSRTSRSQALRRALAQCETGVLVQDITFQGGRQTHESQAGSSNEGTRSQSSEAYGRRSYQVFQYDRSWRSDRYHWNFSQDGQIQFTLKLFAPSDCTQELIQTSNSSISLRGVDEPLYP